MKRIISMIAAATMILVLFCGCGESSNDSQTGSDSSKGPAVTLSFENFSIVRPEGYDAASTLNAGIFRAIKDAKDTKPLNVDDTTEVNQSGEILVGKTNRPESSEAYNMIFEKGTGRAAEYIICCINGNIVINAMSDEALEAAVNKFISDYCTDCTISSDTCYVFSDKGSYVDITVNNVAMGLYKIVVPDESFSYIVMREAEQMVNDIYEKSGYKLEIVQDTAESTDYEIIIENCDRDGVQIINDSDTYAIRYSGNKIYINGGKNYTTAYAVDLFAKELLANNTVKTENATGRYSSADDTNDYKLKWTDEFDTFDSQFWRPRNAKMDEYAYGSWYGMGVWRSSDPKNVYVSDGNLYLTSTYDSENFYGAYLDSAKSLNYTYGYIEMNARIPDGEGIWGCFWVYQDWEVTKDILEFDIMECWGPGDAYGNHIHETIGSLGVTVDNQVADMHIYKDRMIPTYNEYLGTVGQYKRENSFWNEYHTYGMEWTEDEVVFMRDGVVTLRHKYKGVSSAEFLYSQPHHIVLSVLTGSNRSHATDQQADNNQLAITRPKLGADYWTDGRASFIIDYVQLYQKDGQSMTLS